MKTVLYQGHTYHRSQQTWLDRDYLEVDSRRADELDRQFPPPPPDRTQRRQNLKKNRENGRIVLTSQDANDPIAIAILCATYRDRGWHSQALQLTEPWKESTASGVLIARAAVLCDVGRLEEGHDLAQRAAQHGGGYVAQTLLASIRKRWGRTPQEVLL